MQLDIMGKPILLLNLTLGIRTGEVPTSHLELGKITDLTIGDDNRLAPKDEIVFFADESGDLVIRDVVRGETWSLDIFALLMNYQNQREADSLE